MYQLELQSKLWKCIKSLSSSLLDIVPSYWFASFSIILFMNVKKSKVIPINVFHGLPWVISFVTYTFFFKPEDHDLFLKLIFPTESFISYSSSPLIDSLTCQVVVIYADIPNELRKFYSSHTSEVMTFSTWLMWMFYPQYIYSDHLT